MKPLTILNYHGLESCPGEYAWSKFEHPYVLNRSSFEYQMDLLINRGFKTLTLKELSEGLSGRLQVPKPVMITFDDGHQSNLEYAMSSLRKRQPLS